MGFTFCKLEAEAIRLHTGAAGSFFTLKRYKKKNLDWCEQSRFIRKIPGAVLLSHSQIYSTIAAGALNYRVREGNVCVCSAMDTGKKLLQ